MEINQQNESYIKLRLKRIFQPNKFFVKSIEVNFKVAVIIISDRPCKLKFKQFGLSKKSARK